MAQLGKNIRSVAPASSRARVRSFWIDLFGCEHMQPRPELDVFVFDGGARLGVYFVADDIALSDARQREGGTWIEIVVRDADALQRAIASVGIDRLPYHDDGHRYFQAPGGQVFRLAS